MQTTLAPEVDETDAAMNLLEELSRCATVGNWLCTSEELRERLRAFVKAKRPVPYVYNGGRRYRGRVCIDPAER